MFFSRTPRRGPGSPTASGALLLCSLVAALFLLSAGTASAQPEALPAQLAGTWYWETSTYVGAGDYTTLIKSTRTIRIGADGTFTCVESGTHTGTRRYQGWLTRQGNLLIARDAQGRTLTVRFELRGNNGLLLNGVLYERR
jgi:hypothetical protein